MRQREAGTIAGKDLVHGAPSTTADARVQRPLLPGEPVQAVRVFTLEIRKHSPTSSSLLIEDQPYDATMTKMVIAHEVRHMVKMRDYTLEDFQAGRVSIMAPADPLVFPQWTQIPSSYDSVDTAQIQVR